MSARRTRNRKKKQALPSIFSLLNNRYMRYAIFALFFGGTPYAIYNSYVKGTWWYNLFNNTSGTVLNELKKIPENIKKEAKAKIEEKAKVSNEYEEVELPAFVDSDDVIRRTYFTLKYSEEHEQAEWVAYKLTKEQIYGNNKREDEFLPDPLVKTGSATPEDYRGSGFDRGHLAPVADFRFSKEAMLETCIMSNISPQVHTFNDGIWRILEEQVREWVKRDKVLYIVTGPVLRKDLKKIGRENKVSVPNAYYKIIVDLQEPEVKAIAFLMENKPSTKSLQKFIVSINKIERITGINFFHKLPDDLEEKLENATNTKGWF